MLPHAGYLQVAALNTTYLLVIVNMFS